MATEGEEHDYDSDEYEYDSDPADSTESPPLDPTLIDPYPSLMGDAMDHIAPEDALILESSKISGTKQLATLIITLNGLTTFTVKMENSKFNKIISIDGLNYYPNNLTVMFTNALTIYVNQDLDRYKELQSRIERKKASIVSEATTRSAEGASPTEASGGAGGDSEETTYHLTQQTPHEEYENICEMLGIKTNKNSLTRLYKTLKWFNNHYNQVCPVCCHLHSTEQTDLWPCQDSVYCIWMFSNTQDTTYLQLTRLRDFQETFTLIYHLFRHQRTTSVAEVLSEYETDLIDNLTTTTKAYTLPTILEALSVPTSDPKLEKLAWIVFAKSNYRLREIHPETLTTGLEILNEKRVDVAFTIERYITAEEQKKKALIEEQEPMDLLHTTGLANVHSLCSNGALIFSGTARQRHGAALGAGFYLATNYEFMTRYQHDTYSYSFVVHATDTNNKSLYKHSSGQMVAMDTSKLRTTYLFRKKQIGEKGVYFDEEESLTETT